MCKTGNTAKSPAKAEVQYMDDFRSASDKEKTALLKKLNAAGKGYSVVIFTQNYKGAEITASNAKKRLYRGYPISNLKTGIAEQIRIDNSTDTKIQDTTSKAEAVITVKEAQKHKFIYVMKSPPGGESPFRITYSNTLRPLE